MTLSTYRKGTSSGSTKGKGKLPGLSCWPSSMPASPLPPRSQGSAKRAGKYRKASNQLCSPLLAPLAVELVWATSEPGCSQILAKRKTVWSPCSSALELAEMAKADLKEHPGSTRAAAYLPALLWEMCFLHLTAACIVEEVSSEQEEEAAAGLH